MAKNITQNQLTGEIGEAAVRLRFLKIGFQFDVRSRLETGIDAIAEAMIEGRPLAHMIAVQVKATKTGLYPGEDDNGFHYLLRIGGPRLLAREQPSGDHRPVPRGRR
ncbi:DUF4365 domain-containing protein [Rhizobium ruizarguesonis]